MAGGHLIYQQSAIMAHHRECETADQNINEHHCHLRLSFSQNVQNVLSSANLMFSSNHVLPIKSQRALECFLNFLVDP
jgi:hypothetical protein